MPPMVPKVCHVQDLIDKSSSLVAMAGKVWDWLYGCALLSARTWCRDISSASSQGSILGEAVVQSTSIPQLRSNTKLTGLRRIGSHRQHHPGKKEEVSFDECVQGLYEGYILDSWGYEQLIRSSFEGGSNSRSPEALQERI